MEPHFKIVFETSVSISCDVREATHIVKKDGTVHKIASKWGIAEDGRLAKPSEGGFGCVTESGEKIDMWNAWGYKKNEKDMGRMVE